VASWLVGSSPDRALRVWALAGDTMFCSWARHVTLTVPLATQEYKWVPANCRGNLTNCWGETCDGPESRPGVVEIQLTASWYRNRDKPRQLRASQLQGFTFFYTDSPSALRRVISFFRFENCGVVTKWEKEKVFQCLVFLYWKPYS